MIDYGATVTADDAKVFTDDLMPGFLDEGPTEIDATGNALWTYRKEGTINGVAVAKGDTDLPITDESYLRTAFELKTTPRSILLWMSPDEKESIEIYDTLLARAANGEIMIVDETKQYDIKQCKFMVWIRYNEVHYSLHQRFQHLREELQYV